MNQKKPFKQFILFHSVESFFWLKKNIHLIKKCCNLTRKYYKCLYFKRFDLNHISIKKWISFDSSKIKDYWISKNKSIKTLTNVKLAICKFLFSQTWDFFHCEQNFNLNFESLQISFAAILNWIDLTFKVFQIWLHKNLEPSCGNCLEN